MSASDWIEWNGGECPVAPDTLVDVKLDDGTGRPLCPNGDWEPALGFVLQPDNWTYDGTVPNRGWRIIAYRVIGGDQ